MSDYMRKQSTSIPSKKRISIRRKLLFIFGALIFMATVTLAFLAVYIARQAILEKVKAHLTDKT